MSKKRRTTDTVSRGGLQTASKVVQLARIATAGRDPADIRSEAYDMPIGDVLASEMLSTLGSVVKGFVCTLSLGTEQSACDKLAEAVAGMDRMDAQLLFDCLDHLVDIYVKFEFLKAVRDHIQVHHGFKREDAGDCIEKERI